MEDPRWTTSPEQLLQTKYPSNGMGEEKDEYELALDAIDADINLDESTRDNPLYAFSGYDTSAGLNGTGTSEGVHSQKAGDRWSTNTSKPGTMTLKEQEKVLYPTWLFALNPCISLEQKDLILSLSLHIGH